MGNDTWQGGYVEELGYVDIYASSVEYGNSIYNGSWVKYGEQGHPVTQADFQRLADEGRWRGGYVEGYGYVSQEVEILGNTGGDSSSSSGNNPSSDGYYNCAYLCLAELNPNYTPQQYQQVYEKWLRDKNVPDSVFVNKGVYYADVNTFFSVCVSGGTYTTDIRTSGFTQGKAAADIGGHMIMLTEKLSDEVYLGYDPQLGENSQTKRAYLTSNIKQVYIAP